MNKNPFVHKDLGGKTFSVGFQVPNKLEPLWWIGTGFKDLTRVNAREFEFSSEAEAETFIKTEGLDFIKKWRSDQVHLIVGW